MMELVYMGLEPHSRGKGFGQQIVEQAQRLARLAGRTRLVAAVDAANRPAVQTYTAKGFESRLRRRLYIKTLISEV
jgi:GNAT superfamily N-acetyltransferase